MELVQQIIAGVVVVGGAGTLVYYSVGNSGGISIEEHIKSKSRVLIEDEQKWKNKEDIYKKLDEKSEKIINGVENKDSTKTKVWMKIRNWCEKTKNKVFINHLDKTYQSFSQWCLEEIKIQKQLEMEGLKDWSDDTEKMQKRIKEYESSGSNFVTGTGESSEKGGKKKVTENDLKQWCSSNKNKIFKHEMDSVYQNVKKWCFSSKEEPSKTESAPDAPPLKL